MYLVEERRISLALALIHTFASGRLLMPRLSIRTRINHFFVIFSNRLLTVGHLVVISATSGLVGGSQLFCHLLILAAIQELIYVLESRRPAEGMPDCSQNVLVWHPS
jgi:hypothetical protein